MSIATGEDHTVILDEQGYVLTCGNNAAGPLGTGVRSDEFAFQRLTGTYDQFGPARQVSAAMSWTAIVTDAGDLLTCGMNVSGQLGLGDEEDRDVPTRVALDRVRMVACADSFAAALTDDGAVYTFGDGVHGELGHGGVPAEGLRTPTRIPGLAFNHETIVMVAVGKFHALALSEAGHVYAWGESYNGGLGLGDTGHNENEPQRIDPVHFPQGTADRVVFIAANQDYSAAVTLAGELYTWGSGRFGKTGHGDTRHRLVPTRVGLQHVVTVACALEHILAVTRDGRLWATGRAASCYLAAFGTQDRHRFAPVGGGGGAMNGPKFVMTDSYFQHSVAVTDEGELWSFGRNRWGQLGHNDTGARRALTRVDLRPRIGRCRYLPVEHALAFALGTHRRLGAASPMRLLAGESGLLVMIANFGRARVEELDGAGCEGIVRLLGGVTAEDRPRYRERMTVGN